MENVGLVTYNEIYMYRGQTPSIAKRLRFSITNLHELAHMWFGNMVTMKWWNDLWLNEAFATYISFLAMARIPELKHFHTVWATYLQYKFWGISDDCLSTTHPISTDIPSTAEAESIFDGISYGKSSAWLKQVFHILGYDTFRLGLHKYFAKYKWKNTVLEDFVGSLDEAWQESNDKSLGDDFNFKEWCMSWLETSGINILTPIVTYNDDQSVKSFAISQTCDLRGKNRLRTHKINVAFYDE